MLARRVLLKNRLPLRPKTFDFFHAKILRRLSLLGCGHARLAATCTPTSITPTLACSTGTHDGADNPSGAAASCCPASSGLQESLPRPQGRPPDPKCPALLLPRNQSRTQRQYSSPCTTDFVVESRSPQPALGLMTPAVQVGRSDRSAVSSDR